MSDACPVQESEPRAPGTGEKRLPRVEVRLRYAWGFMQGTAHGVAVLHVGERGGALGERLDAVYETIVRSTRRHFGVEGPGWTLSGVAGLDTPTMNRAVVRDADVGELPDVLAAAGSVFGERQVPWSTVLSSFRDTSAWHAGLVGRGLHLSNRLDVLARPPGIIEDSAAGADVRLVEPAEFGRFTDLLLEIFHMPRRFYPALVDMTESWARLGARVYFAMDEGEPVATTLLVVQDGVAGIYNVGTRRAWRRRGLARSLMARAMQDAVGADVVTLQVAPSTAAEAFYLRLGFDVVHEWRFYVPGPGFRLA